MDLLSTIIKYLVVIALGFGVFYFDDLEFFDTVFSKIVLLTICFGKCFYFIYESYKKILETNDKNIPYHNFLIFMAVNVSLMVISFGVDNYCLYKMEPASYSGLNGNYNEFHVIFEFFYYSLLGFTNFGFGVLVPESLTAKSLVMFEIILSFVSIIFILSDFISLKESISKRKNVKNV